MDKLLRQLHSQELKLAAMQQLADDFRAWESTCSECRYKPENYYCDVCTTAVSQMHLAADMIDERLRTNND